MAHVPLEDGYAAIDGDLTIPGIAGTGAPVRLDFLDPGGATTGKLLPTGSAVDTSICPAIPSSNSNAVALAMGEKGAGRVLAEARA